MKLSVIIPIYNEINTLQIIIDRVIENSQDAEILLVGDSSTDGTRDLLTVLDGLYISAWKINQEKP